MSKSFSTVVAIFASEPFALPSPADCTASGQLSTQLFCGMAEAYLCPYLEKCSKFEEILSGGEAVQQEHVFCSAYCQNVIKRVFGAASGRTPDKVAALDAAVPTAPPSPTSNEEDTERPLAGFDIEGRCAPEARGPSLYVGDCTLKAWFAERRLKGKQAGGATQRIINDRGTQRTQWKEGEHQQVCVMWPRLSLGNDRIPEEALIEALRSFPESLQVMWMLTPTVRGTNMAAMQQEYSDEKKYPGQKRWSQGRKVWECLEKQIGFKNYTPFMCGGLNGMWGPTIIDVLWSNEDWLTLETGLTDPCHPSRTGLNKYKKLAWDAMGRHDFLSIKIIDGWNFQESTDCSFEGYAREMRMLLQTRYVGHAIDVLQMMLRYPQKSVPLGTMYSPRELMVVRQGGSIRPPGLNPATVATRWRHREFPPTRTPPPFLNPATIAEDVARIQELQESTKQHTASGQGSGGMEAESGASRSGGGSCEIEENKAIFDAVVEGMLKGGAQWHKHKKVFQQWHNTNAEAQGNTEMDAEQGLDLRKNTAKRKAPPPGNTVMDAKEGLEPKNNTLRQKLVFSCGDQKVPYKFVSEEYRKRVARRVDQICENPDLLQAENPETERDKRDREEFGMYPAAGGQLKAWDHGQEDSCWPPRLHAPPPSAQHGLRPVVGQSLGLGHGQDSPTVSDQVVPPPLPLAPPPSVADASPAAPFPPAPPAAHAPPHPPSPSKPEPRPPPPRLEKAGGCVLHTAGKRRLVLTPNPNYKRSAPRQTLFFRRELEPFDIFRVDK